MAEEVEARRSRECHGFLRAPARAGDALHDGDVGALQLLRDARPADPLHDAPAASGGLGFDVAKAGAVYGLYTAMVYMLSLPGGWIADRFLGQRKAVLYGGILIAAGNLCLAVPALASLLRGTGAVHDRAPAC